MEVEDDDEEKEEEAETGDEGSGASDSDERHRARWNRPTGLRYRIRRKGTDVTKDSIDFYIGKRRQELEALLVDQFGTKWQEFYKLGGTGEELEAAAAAAAAEGEGGDDCGGSSGGGAASGGIEAGPPCNHVPHVLHAMLDDMGRNRQVEENAQAVRMKQWREKAVKMFTDIASTSRVWKRLRILLSHTKDPATGLYVPLLWPHGIASLGEPGYDWIQTEIGKIMGTLGMEPSDLCCKVNTRAAILDRAEFLDSMNLLPLLAPPSQPST
eukprot:jgi/Tetstr1/422596/TSEL_013403.t1